MKCLVKIAPAALSLIVAINPAKAEDVFSTMMAGGFTELENWDVKLGGGVAYAPKFEGSKDHKVSAMPYLDITWKDTIFLNPVDGLGVNIFKHEGFTFGGSVGYDGGRKEKDSRKELTGLGNVKGGAQGSLFASYQYSFLETDVKINKTFSGSKSLTVDAGVSAFIPLVVLMGSSMGGDVSRDDDEGPNGPVLTLGASTTWADKNHMESYFGVTNAQSAASGLKQFTAKSGFKSVSGSIGLIVPVTDHVIIGSKAEYTKLIGDAADSSITRKEDQFSGQLFTVYKF